MRCRYKRQPSADDDDAWQPDLPEEVPGQPFAAQPTALRLFKLVERKQIHECRDGGCRHNRRASQQCRMGFPFPTNHEGTKFDPATNRCVSVWARVLAAAIGLTTLASDAVFLARGAPRLADTCTGASATWTSLWCPTTRPCCWRGGRTRTCSA